MGALMPLPLTPQQFIDSALNPGLAMLPVQMDSPRARLMILTICLQESGLAARRQLGDGPARGLAQFERGGGVRGVLTHRASADLAVELCQLRGVSPTASAAWAALEFDDVLAVGFARLLLLTDPEPLPQVGDADGAWDLYLRAWRPGKPHVERWAGHYATARAALGV